MYITLEEAKKHLNVEPEYVDDDAYITSLIEVAESAVEVHVNRPLTEIAGKHEGRLPAPLRQAALLLIGTYYMSRETTAPSRITELPFGYQYLIRLYQNWN